MITALDEAYPPLPFDPLLLNANGKLKVRRPYASQSFSPELNLLLACITQDSGGCSHEFAGTGLGLDWQKFLGLTRHHRVIPQVYRRLQECDDVAPSDILETLRAHYEASVRQSLRLTRDLLQITKHFAANGIPALPYKGPALAAMLDVDVTERQFSDLDLLVRPSDVARGKAALAELGYSPKYALSRRQERSYIANGYEHPFDLPDANNVLELKWRLLPRFYSVDFDVQALFARSVYVEVSGHTIKTLCPEDMLLAICVHAAKHAWSELSLLWDVHRLTQSQPIDLQKVRQHAAQLGIQRIVEINLFLVQSFFEDSPARTGLNRGNRSGPASFADTRIFPIIAGHREVDIESLSYFRLMLALRERLSDRLRFVWRLLTNAGMGEWSQVTLPSPLFFLYHLIRIFRLASRFVSPRFAQSRPTRGSHAANTD